MKTDKLIDAIGQIDDNKIRNAKVTPGKIKRISFRRAVAMVAAIILCITISVPVLAATVDPIYLMVYRISPTLAQMLKPVQLSCEDNGIRMEVLSAAVYENEAAIYISLQDLTDQNRIDETTDLFDSYHINRAFDSSASCNRVSFDEETGIATFLINISQWNDQEIGGDKITFYFTEFLGNKSKFEGELTELDLNSVAEAKKTQMPESFRGGGGKEFDYESRFDLKYLVPVDGGILSPVDGVTVTNVGFVDGKLHVQLYFENILSYDNHGYIRMYDEEGNQAESYHFSFWDDKKVGSYEEIIYDISPEDIENYKAFGYFVTCKSLTKGHWQVTFPLENMN
ncbi:MAG: DUF4179 domain-containing protein [Clostridia bacterium]|nr:DUF4179 domain-containing protein [Clostridia bacterium]MBQ7095777.1 DUF4179 domain-containing protein [Clostridia bacterium]